MADLQHKDIPDPERHEPKNISTATADQVYAANGAGSGTWKILTEENVGLSGGLVADVVVSDGAGGFAYRAFSHGSTSFVNISTPYTLTYPATYAKVAPTTVAGGMPQQVTEGTNARLTYTGTPTQHFHVAVTVSAAQSSGANRDIRFAIYKNGSLVTSSETVQTTTTGVKVSTALHCDTSLSTNDYLEVYAQNDGASGDITVYSLYVFMMGMLKG